MEAMPEAGIDLSGGVLRPDNDASRDFYGHAVAARELLVEVVEGAEDLPLRRHLADQVGAQAPEPQGPLAPTGGRGLVAHG